MKKQILVTLPVNEEHKAYLGKCLEGFADDFEFVYTDGADPTDAQLSSATVLLGTYSPVCAKKAENAEWVQLASAGADAFTKPGILKENVILTNAVGAYGLTVSEHMLALTFAIVHRFGQYVRRQAEHSWKDMGPLISIENATVLVLGVGDIGGSYARKMKALGAYVIGARKNVHEKPDWLDEQVTIDRLDEVLPRADIVAMVLPSGDDTYHIMNESRFSLMKDGAFIINAGRGNSIDPAALKDALYSGRLAGAALDVTEPEPLPTGDELWDMENVIITPHVAGWLHVPETLDRIIGIAGENLSAWLKGEPMRNLVSH